jgi:hypothetical protein
VNKDLIFTPITAGLPGFQDAIWPNGPAHWARIGHLFLLNKNAYKAKIAPLKTPD